MALPQIYKSSFVSWTTSVSVAVWLRHVGSGIDSVKEHFIVEASFVSVFVQHQHHQTPGFKMDLKLLTGLMILSVFLQQIECKRRVYYIAAIDVEWDYAPSGRDVKNGAVLDNEE